MGRGGGREEEGSNTNLGWAKIEANKPSHTGASDHLAPGMTVFHTERVGYMPHTMPNGEAERETWHSLLTCPLHAPCCGTELARGEYTSKGLQEEGTGKDVWLVRAFLGAVLPFEH